MTEDTRKGTCETCGRSRKLWRCGDGYRWRCSECKGLTAEEREAKRAERQERTRARTLAKKKAYPIIGGPLDGEHAMTVDFERTYGKPGDKWYRAGGMYAHLAGQYEEYNSSGGRGPSMIFVHVGVLQPVKPGRER